MKIDNNLEKRINKLRKKYPLFSRENKILNETYFWIRDIVNSAIPDCQLAVANGKLDSYINSKNPNRGLISELKEMVQYCQEKYINEYFNRRFIK